MKMVELIEYTGRPEAEMMLDILTHHGIKSILRSDDLAGLNPSLGLVNGYQIMVIEEQLTEALSLIKKS
ncbi:MAG: DUF2007 domain-containing protein [Spirochaetales bacterium]|nr:DUF2007 domain-containing protein [Spirochaetales bacterium]